MNDEAGRQDAETRLDFFLRLTPVRHNGTNERMDLTPVLEFVRVRRVPAYTCRSRFFIKPPPQFRAGTHDLALLAEDVTFPRRPTPVPVGTVAYADRQPFEVEPEILRLLVCGVADVADLCASPASRALVTAHARSHSEPSARGSALPSVEALRICRRLARMPRRTVYQRGRPPRSVRGIKTGDKQPCLKKK